MTFSSILLDGDTANFNPVFGEAIVMPKPGVITGSGDALKYGDKSVCVEGDEKSVKVAGCSYMTPEYSVPGEGTLTIETLHPYHKTLDNKVNSKPILTTGVNQNFIAKFEVTKPAETLPARAADPPSKDPASSYLGTGTFLNKYSAAKVLPSSG